MLFGLLEQISSAYEHSAKTGQVAGMVTSLEFLGTTLSSLRKLEVNVERLSRSYQVFFCSCWPIAVSMAELSVLIPAALLQCVGKVIKFSKLQDSAVLRSTCCSLLQGDLARITVGHGDTGGASMLWRLYLKLCVQMLTYTSVKTGDAAGADELKLSEWILSVLLVQHHLIE